MELEYYFLTEDLQGLMIVTLCTCICQHINIFATFFLSGYKLDGPRLCHSGGIGILLQDSTFHGN
jgi:hypothetical protein